MGGMFYSAQVFNQDIGQWNTAAVTNMEDMFRFAYAFNQYLRGGWDVTRVTQCSRFNANTALTNANSPAFTSLHRMITIGIWWKCRSRLVIPQYGWSPHHHHYV